MCTHIQGCLQLRDRVIQVTYEMTHSQVSSQPQVGAKLLKLRNYGGLGAHSQLSALKGVEGRAETPRWD